MKITIITPTIQRDSLIKCCESVNTQTYRNWEHWIVVDLPKKEIDFAKLQLTMHQNRHYLYCDTRHNDYGHTCTRNVWEKVTGEVVWRLDDDNALSRPDALEDIIKMTADWGIFPIMREGQRFFNDPPKQGHIDTGNVVVKREFARWTESTRYEADWDFIEQLMINHPNYQSFPDIEPIMILPVINRGN